VKNQVLKELREIVILSLPVLSGYGAVGIAFGMVAVSAGLSWWLILLMSLCIYAGALQLIAIPWMIQGLSLPTMFVMSLLVSARQMMYGLSMFPYFSDMGKAKGYMIFSLTDETYALLVTQGDHPLFQKRWTRLVLSFLNQSYWVMGSMLGVYLGSTVGRDLVGMEFSLIALFASLLLDAWEKKDNRVMILYGLLVTWLSLMFFGPRWFLLPAMAVLVVMSWLKEGRNNSC